MNKQKDTGGPAFPTSYNSDYPAEIVGGMTLRDYFASGVAIGDLEGYSTTAAAKLVWRDMPDYRDDFIGNAKFWAEFRAKLRYIESDAVLAEKRQEMKSQINRIGTLLGLPAEIIAHPGVLELVKLVVAEQTVVPGNGGIIPRETIAQAVHAPPAERSCTTCKHKKKDILDAPCINCDANSSNWEPK